MSKDARLAAELREHIANSDYEGMELVAEALELRKVDPVRDAAPDLLEALKAISELSRQHASENDLGSSEHRIVHANIADIAGSAVADAEVQA